MPYRVEIAESAAKAIRAIPTKERTQVLRRIAMLADDPRPPASIQLKGLDKLRRLRSGDYRVIYSVGDRARVVKVAKVGDRRDVYDDL